MNDMILNLLANDSFTVSDFKAVGLTAENTKLESEDKYKASKMIQENELFQKDGEFNELLFHQYYLGATEFYNRLADETYIDDLTEYTYYSKDALLAPDNNKVIDETPKFIISPNPFLQNNSLTRVGKKGDRTLSISEIALSQKIYDSDTKTFRKESVNDRALGNNPFKWLGDLFSEPLVIAQWDEDGTHTDLLTGEIRTHKKGDYKYNDEGTFYYETLNGRDVYGKQVLNRMNTLTVDGSAANAYDFFDSDDLQQKSVIGNTMKNLALVGSMFLPHVGPYVIAASIATQSVGLLGALGKMFLGSDNETANTLHAWAKTVDRHNTTEYASQNTWCWENLINMVGDVMGQLKEQRFLFTHVPALFKGTKGIKAQKTKTYNELVAEEAAKISKKTGKDLNKAIASIKSGLSKPDKIAELLELGLQHSTIAQLKASAALEKYMEGYRHLGSTLSKAYMTGIVVLDTYGEAKANGASDLEAFALTLGYAAGEAIILNTGLGEWIMPELHGHKLRYKAIINALKQNLGLILDTATKEGRQNWFKSFFNAGKKIVTDDYARLSYMSQTYTPMKVVAAHAAGEAFEELSEELLADFSKSAFNTVNWLRGDETRINSAWENVADRYSMALLGGFLGGGFSSISTDFSQAQQLAKMTTESALQEIVYMINNNKIDDFLKFANKQQLGNKHLSFALDENGNFKPGTGENNLDAEIKKMLNYQVKIIKDVINAEGAKFSENSLFDALTLRDLRYLQLRNTSAASLMMQEYNSLVSDIFKKSEELRKATGHDTNTDTKKKELSDSEEQNVKKLREELDELRKQKDAIVTGKRAPEFIATALYEATPALHGYKNNYQFLPWVERKTKKNFNEIPKVELEKLKEEYNAWKKTTMKNDILSDARLFIDLVGLSSKAILDSLNYINSVLKDDHILSIYTLLSGTMDNINASVDVENFDADEFLENTQKLLSALIEKTQNDLALKQNSLDYQARLAYIENADGSNRYNEEVKNLDKASVILETFADYIDTITNNYVQHGYINPEIKNFLILTYTNAKLRLENIKDYEAYLSSEEGQDFNLLARFSAFLGKSLDEVEEIGSDGVRSDLFKDYIKNIDTKIEQLKNLTHTPIVKILEDFKSATSDSDTSIKEIMDLINTIINLYYYDIANLLYDLNFDSKLKEVEEVIDLHMSALYATRVDKASVNNSWGYSKTLNELNKKYKNENWVELAEIEGNVADLIMQDLAIIKQKIQFARNIKAVNSGQKLNTQNKIGLNLKFIFFNKFERLINILPDEIKNKWNLNSLYEALGKIKLLKEYNSKELSKRKFALTPEEKVEIEKESLLLDDAIYLFFDDNSDKLNNVDELSKLISADIFNFYDPANKLLNDSTEDLDDRSFIFSLAAKAALKSSDFHNILMQIANPKNALVPMLQLAVYLNVAMVLNGDVINNFAKAYSKSIMDNFKNKLSQEQRDDLLKNFGYNEKERAYYATNPDAFLMDSAVEKFLNVVLTEGIAGSGKTRAVFDATKRFIEKVNPDLLKNSFLVHSTIENAKNLSNDLELLGKSFTSNDSEITKDKSLDLLNYFYTDFSKESYKDKIKIHNNAFTHKYTLRKDLKDFPKIIFIDEISKYDYVLMKLLSEAALHYGIIILTAGDFDQISAKSYVTYAKSSGVNTLIQLSPTRLNFIGSSKLGASFRTLNSQMTKTLLDMLAYLHEEGKKEFDLHYWEDDKEIRGFKSYTNHDFDKVVESIEKLKKLLKPDEKIGFLYANKETSMHAKLKEKFGDLLDDKSIDSAQGLEGKYYIIDITLEDDGSKSEQDYRNELYTAITRAEIGGIIINSRVSDAPLRINNILDTYSILESITPEAISRANLKYNETFTKIFKDYPDPIIEYHPVTRIEMGTIVNSNDEVEEGIAPPIGGPSSPIVPPGMFKTREEAEKVDLSAYKAGLLLYNKSDDTLAGTIEKIDILEHEEGGNIFYTPVVVIKNDVETKGINHNNLNKYVIKDPSSNKSVPKYIKGDIFYDENGNPLEIIEVIEEDPIKYKIKDSTNTIQEVTEDYFDSYSKTPPESKRESEEDDLDEDDGGENDNSEEYKSRRLVSNSSKETITVNSDGTINHRLYTFCGYETGVLWDGDHIKEDHFIEEDVKNRTEKRVDNVNGLLKLGAVKRNSTKEKCLRLLAGIHSELMNNVNNANLLEKVSLLLGFRTNIFNTIEYGIKSSAGISSKDPSKIYGTPNAEGFTDDTEDDITKDRTNFYVFDKHRDEKSEYSQPNVLTGNDISRKSVVAVFRDANGKKLLEITLGPVNSPLTIGLTLNNEGNYIFPEIGQRIEQLSENSTGQEIFDACKDCIKICKEKGYTDLHELFKAFIFTSNAFAPLHPKNEDFNLASLESTGPNIVPVKGNYLKNGKKQYEVEYIDLDEYVKDDRVVVSEIFIPKNNVYGGYNLPRIHKGHAGVFVTYNKRHREENLANIYLQQQSPSYTGRKDVEFYYIIPPEATVREYLKNYRNAYLNKKEGGTRTVLSIGNLWTSYKLLRNIHNAGELNKTSFKSKIYDDLEFTELIEYIEKLNSFETTDWTNDVDYKNLLEQYKTFYANEKVAEKYAKRNIILQKLKEILLSLNETLQIPVYKVLNNWITSAAYWTSNNEEKPNENIISIIERYNNGTIKYKVKYKEVRNANLVFIPALVEGYKMKTITSEGNVELKGFLINRKIDSPVYTFYKNEYLKGAISILADWEYEDPNNTNSRKKPGKRLLSASIGYMRDEKSVKKSKTNFELLKENNKILFKEGGLFANISVTNEDDKDKDLLSFVQEILEQFNSVPNHLGFAIVDTSARGLKIKMYAYEIDKLTTGVEKLATESVTGLGGVTIGKSLIFTSGLSYEFDHGDIHYEVNIEGNNIKFTRSSNKKPILTKVEKTKNIELGELDYNDFINTVPENKHLLREAIQRACSTFEKFISLDTEGLSRLKKAIELSRIDTEPFKKLFNYLSNNPSLNDNINIKIGDTLTDSEGNKLGKVEIINDNVITLDNSSIVDLNLQEVYKLEHDSIMCTNTILIKFK